MTTDRSVTERALARGWVDEGMKIFICENQGEGPRYWILEWVGETRIPSISPKWIDFPIFFQLPFRSHVELRKRLYTEGYVWIESTEFSKFIAENPGDGGVEYNADGTVFHPKI